MYTKVHVLKGIGYALRMPKCRCFTLKAMDKIYSLNDKL